MRHATSDSNCSTNDAPPVAKDTAPLPAAGDAAAPPETDASPIVESTAGDVDKPLENRCARAARLASQHAKLTTASWASPLVTEVSASSPIAQLEASVPVDKSSTMDKGPMLLADELAYLVTGAFKDRRDINILPQLHLCLEAAIQLNETRLIEVAQQAIALARARLTEAPAFS